MPRPFQDTKQAFSILAACSALLAGTPVAEAQNRSRPDTVNADQLPPQIKLGLRAATIRHAIPTADAVVLVPDERAYYDALSAWTQTRRFPILIEDGSYRSIEDAARFVRAFRPARVVRWAPEPQDSGLTLREHAVHAVDAAWDWEPDEDRDNAARVLRWRSLGPVPPAVVIADESDPARAGAAALAATYALPLAWADLPNGLNRVLEPGIAGDIEAACRRAAIEAGLSWSDLGDEADAIALCANAGVKVRMGGLQTGSFIALTDVIGRHENGERWAWAGQIHGDARESVYRAMSSVFLRPERAWLFDAYEGGEPWSAYDATAARNPLENARLEVVVLDEPRQGIRHWRSAVSGAIDAGLVFVNSSGNRNFFNLRPGRGDPGDAPFLDVPAAVHFVHSWSANAPADERTVAGRWLARGAFAYTGSVEEPYLSAFVQTPQVAARLAGGAAWAAAVRNTPSPAWKVQVFGDPLFTLAAPAPKRGDQLPLEGITDLTEEMRSAARDRRTAEAARALVLLGRDADAASLAKAAVNADEPIDPDLARVALLPLLRERARREVISAFRALSDEGRDEDARDALWHAAQPMIVIAESHPDTTGLLSLLTENQRAGQEFADAITLSVAWRTAAGQAAAVNVLRQAAERLPEGSGRRRNAERRIERFINGG
ncbi:MAG: hypothetical protein AAGG07_07800 [Planctomycetota bacterium]